MTEEERTDYYNKCGREVQREVEEALRERSFRAFLCN